MSIYRLFNRFANIFVLAVSSILFISNSFALGSLGPTGATASAGDYSSAPPLAVTGADPFLMVDLSVELTQQAEGYPDGASSYCSGRLTNQYWNGSSSVDMGICYLPAQTYIGYFDSEKCYTYDTTTYSNTNTDQQATGPRTDAAPHFFKPDGKATNHTCSGKFSGNFLNWATMTALDEFRGAMTGGARLIDTAGTGAQTMLIRTRRFDDWSFVLKGINSGGLTATAGGASIVNNPSTVTPFTSTNFTAPATTSTTTSACSCSVSNSPGKCTKSNSSDQNPTSCSCTQVVAKTYQAANSLLVVNNWSGLSAGKSLHKTRFYSYNNGNTKTTVTTTYIRSGYTCPTVAPTVTTTYPTPTLLTVGGDSDINVIVKACDPSSSAGGLEANCIKYTDGTNIWYKPEGLLQKNSLKMKYALTSYTGRSGNAINGGVLRSNAKYIGSQMPTGTGGIQINPNAEIDAQGLVIKDPDKLSGKVGVNGVSPINSGIINYINQFALFNNAYKSNDPDAELYYEGLRYLMNLGPTNSFWNPPSTNGGPLTAGEQDGFPVLGAGTAGSPAWSDPIVSSCQKNFTLYVGDKNTHRQNYLPDGYRNPNNPGYAFGSNTATDDPICTTECTDAVNKGIHTASLENDIGSREGYDASHDYGNEHGDGLAALAWWAHTHDIRTDIIGDQMVKTFIVDTQEYSTAPPVGKDNTLWRAAKWGGFEDSNNDKFGVAAVPSPDLTSEWNAKGAVYSDGTLLPDTYTLASQPANMVAGLTSAFDNVLQGTSSAAAAAVVANSSVGTAAIYQALYQPRTANNTTAVTWTGLVRAFFIDDQGRIREDTNHNGVLDANDNVIKFRQDKVNAQDVLRVTRTTSGGAALNTDVLAEQLTPALQPIWDAGKQLASLSDSAALTQRAYTASASTGRYIFTWIDANNNGVIDSGEIKDFTVTNFPTINASTNDTNFDPARLLGLDSVSGSNATKLINYIRGVDQSGYRVRKIDQNDGNGAQTLRLGDVVHSAPLMVGAPAQSYDSLYGDTSYTEFKARYKNRRQVLYAGANDGMLHAFNGGFFDAATNGFYNAPNATNNASQSPLGSELWAYVPYNLLPHLQWLTDPAYQHVYYVDGTPQQFDVNIFSDACPDVTTCDHPNGWGTILVVGFRLGGGDMIVNANTDQTSGLDTGNRTLRSAYLVFDITNPENPPQLLGELSQPTLGFTVSKPTVVKRRVPNGTDYKNPSANQWYLVMGSGPAGTDSASKQLAMINAVSNQQAGVFVYNLNTLTWVDANTTTTVVDSFPISGAANSFVGDMTTQDWNTDYSDEVVYFGTIGQGASPQLDPTGDLIRMTMPAGLSFGAPTFSTLLSGNTNTPHNGQPFSMAPLAVRDVSGQAWVYAGSGRFYVSSDVLSNKQMSYYGIKELMSGGVPTTSPVAKSSLINTTGIQLYSDGSITDSSGQPVLINSVAVNNYSGLAQAIQSAGGWYFDFNGTAERDVDVTEQFFDSLFITAYTTSGDKCSPLGSSRRIAASLTTGTASPTDPLSGTTSTGTHLILFSTDLGRGQFFSSGIVSVGLGANQKYLDITQGSMSDSYANQRFHNVTLSGRRMSWKELPIQ